MGDSPQPKSSIYTVLRNPWVRFIGLILLILLGLKVIYVIRGILIPFCLAMIAAYIFDPVVDWLESLHVGRLRIGRRVAVAILLIVFMAVVSAIVFVAIPNAIMTAKSWLGSDQFHMVSKFLPDDWQEGITRWLSGSPDERQAIVSRLVTDVLHNGSPGDVVSRSIYTIATSTFTAALWIFQFLLFFVIMVFLLIDIDGLRSRIKNALPLRYKDEILRIGGRIDANLKSFFRGQMIVVLIDSTLFLVGLAAIGTPFWYVIGITGGLGIFVPYFYLVSGLVPALIVTTSAYPEEPWRLAATAGVFLIGATVDSVFVTPRVLGRRIGIHPVAVILSVLVFGKLFGFLGVLFAVPIAAVVKVIAEELFDRYKASELYNGQPQ